VSANKHPLQTPLFRTKMVAENRCRGRWGRSALCRPGRGITGVVSINRTYMSMKRTYMSMNRTQMNINRTQVKHEGSFPIVVFKHQRVWKRRDACVSNALLTANIATLVHYEPGSRLGRRLLCPRRCHAMFLMYGAGEMEITASLQNLQNLPLRIKRIHQLHRLLIPLSLVSTLNCQEAEKHTL